MRRNVPLRMAANTIAHVGRRAGAVGARWFRAPLVPDPAFQDDGEPYPGHWRRFPEPWPSAGTSADLAAALDALPEMWREVLLRRDGAGHDDARVAEELRLTVAQERDVLARARAELRARLDAAMHPEGSA
jgi:RNA polymerase sigma-70 factor (ECF subfamily)